MGFAWASPRLIRVHFWVATFGILLLAAPLAVGGLLEGFKMNEPALPFVTISRFTLHFLRVSTVGELLIALGNLLLLLNLVASALRVVRAPFAAAYSSATEDLYPVAEARS